MLGCGNSVASSRVSGGTMTMRLLDDWGALDVHGPGPYTITPDDAARTLTVSLGTPYSDAIYGFLQPSTGVVEAAVAR